MNGIRYVHRSRCIDKSGLRRAPIAVSRMKYTVVSKTLNTNPDLGKTCYSRLRTDQMLRSTNQNYSLEGVINSVPFRDMHHVMGKCRAYIGHFNQTTTHMLGRYGLEQNYSNCAHRPSFADHVSL